MVEIINLITNALLALINLFVELQTEILQVWHRVAIGNIQKCIENVFPENFVEIARKLCASFPDIVALLYFHIFSEQHHKYGSGDTEQISLELPRFLVEHLAASEVFSFNHISEHVLIVVPIQIDCTSKIDELQCGNFVAQLESVKFNNLLFNKFIKKSS